MMVKGPNARQSRASSSAGDGEVTTTVVLREMLNRIEVMKTEVDIMNVCLDLPRAKVPPENIPCFDGTKVREFLEDCNVFGMSHGWSDKQKLKALLAYVEPKMRVSVTKMTQGLTTWAEVRQKMLEEYAKYDVPTTMQNLLDVRCSKYVTLDQFLEDFERVARRVPFLDEAQKWHVLLTNFAEDERKSVVMEDICPEVTFPYIDDNPVKGPKEKDETLVNGRVRRFVWDHAQGVAKLLERLVKYNLTVSGSKSLLFQREVTILGFRCFLEGRSPNPKKVDKLMNWPMLLKTVGEVRSFLGVYSFWRIFIPGFAKIAEPLREMVRQGASLGWSDQREKVARTLQDKLRDGGVVLGVPYFDDERERSFIIEVDGGPIALGGVLVQRDENGKERPLRFESRTLNSVERGYIKFRKELLAILHCLRVFRHYIMGRRFILRTDSTAVIGAVKRHQQVDVMVTEEPTRASGGTLGRPKVDIIVVVTGGMFDDIAIASVPPVVAVGFVVVDEVVVGIAMSSEVATNSTAVVVSADFPDKEMRGLRSNRASVANLSFSASRQFIP
ncbi:hypothetical protein CBR_g3423 [Chara braunii]|uniref:Reverse transcriptase RNase H-like domain-containing protein n=1 Tax=Chara braunii TaxID=69332 RepID=A0A388JQS7_CHABU|nr:hypothetical protein CBR_g3423 [Chara braunii]|eukprot:GBG60179.1 hypothetical protein CBR_g3423 [Chara braunii]